MSDFTKTPSYFNNNETFEKYLGQTSYYLALQNAVEKIVAIINPIKVLELGAATGATTIKLAEKFKDVNFVGIDMRSDVTDIASNEAKVKNIANVKFITDDMCEIVKKQLDVDLIYMLYSYHHILDPIEDKIAFLKNAYKNMKNKSYLCIAETFIPETATDLYDSVEILNLWRVRKEEGAASTFWKALGSFKESDLELTHQIAEYSRKNEYLAGELVAKRQDEYLIKRSWLAEIGSKIGFRVVIDEPVNALGDGVIVFAKENY